MNFEVFETVTELNQIQVDPEPFLVTVKLMLSQQIRNIPEHFPHATSLNAIT